jgi:hypothetical protein
VEVETGVAQQPLVDRRRLMSAEIVEDYMHVELGGHFPVDLVQKGDEIGAN